ncbi:hypothetical protein GT755_19130 [Herbidospora sp. NEAU-GS84]|uniref:Uncharacterized protein n=1 Tax=Herbidospora solisilvae TaxID=2696284 RepID=A0A7C9JVW0_9ACTN|nr:hypothetical protein [Herbidospora solisilvae]NAS23799.1 hypothetical protein [Herbidospora solisilvae]
MKKRTNKRQKTSSAQDVQPSSSLPSASQPPQRKSTATKTTPARLSTGTGTKATPPTKPTAGTKRKESDTRKTSSEGARKKQATETTRVARPDPVMEDLTFTYPGLSTVKKGGEGAFIDARLKLLSGSDTDDGTAFVAAHGKDDPGAVEWLMRAVCVFSENAEVMIEAGMTFGPVIPRLLKQATHPGRKPFDALSRDLEKQALQVSGWTKGILLWNLKPPSPESLEKLQSIYYSKSRATTTTTTMALDVPQIGPLDKAVLRTQLWTSLEELLDNHNKGWAQTEERSIREIRLVANVIQDVVELAFGKFVLARPDSPYHSGFKYSDKIVSTTSRDVSPKALKNFLKNRSDVVGNDKNSAVYEKANYDPGRREDVEARDAILDEMVKSSALRKKVVRAVQTNGAHSPGTGTIYVQPFISTQGKKTDELWQQSRTMMHEFLHFLTHPQFRKVAGSIDQRQVMIEGVTDLLTALMFRRFVDIVRQAPALTRIVLGGLPFAAPPERLFQVGYRSAGTKAGQIFDEVGFENIEAAYFLGATTYIGVEKKKKEKKTEEMEVL